MRRGARRLAGLAIRLAWTLHLTWRAGDCDRIRKLIKSHALAFDVANVDAALELLETVALSGSSG